MSRLEFEEAVNRLRHWSRRQREDDCFRPREAALSPRWMTFNDADFHQADMTVSIEVEVTIGELSRTLLSDGRFGLYLRGLNAAGRLNDEREDGDEPVLTVRLSVDATMGPAWSLVCDRYSVPKVLSKRDRAKFCLVRLAGDEPRHLL